MSNDQLAQSNEEKLLKLYLKGGAGKMLSITVPDAGKINKLSPDFRQRLLENGLFL
jgi:hypothetical protein